MFEAVDVVAVETTVDVLTTLTGGRTAVPIPGKAAAFISGTLTIEPGRALLPAACIAAELLAPPTRGSIERVDVGIATPSS